jgi:tripartite-type tricarboxylate transporter receptor subunit TctC
MSGIVTRTGTPPAVIAKLNAAINDGLAMPDVRLGFAKLGIDPNPGTPEEFSAIIARDAPRWAEIVRVTGITAAQ